MKNIQRQFSALRTGFVTYSTGIDIKRFSKPAETRAEINRLSLSPGYESLANALKSSSERLFKNSKTEAKKILVVFAFNKVTDDVISPLNDLNQQGVVVKVIALNDQLSDGDLKNLGDPDQILDGNNEEKLSKNLLKSARKGLF